MMKYEILDKAELDAGVEFYQAYFYGMASVLCF